MRQHGLDQGPVRLVTGDDTEALAVQAVDILDLAGLRRREDPRMAFAARGDSFGIAVESPTDTGMGATLAVTELAANPRECTTARIRVWSMRTRVAQADDSTRSRTRSLRRPAKPTCPRSGVGNNGTMR